MRVLFCILFLWLLQGNTSAQNMFRTACQGNLVRLDSMLSNKSINVKDSRGRSLLHWAVACKKKNVFDFLIDKGIDINSTDNFKRTPMHVAVQFNNAAYLEFLMKLQQSDLWKSEHGASLLELAVLNNNEVALKRLVAVGININSTNTRGSTPLEIAQRLEAHNLSKLLRSLGADTNLVRSYVMKGPYMGEKAPGLVPKLFAPNFISTEEEEFGSIFNKAGNEFFFGVHVKGKSEIRYAKMEGGLWTKPKVILSHPKYGYNDPFLSNDEKRLFYISKRALDGKGKLKDVDIWYSNRTKDGWSEPINAGTKINTSGNEYYISFTKDGTLYFGSNGHNPNRKNNDDYDIYYAKFVDGKFQQPVSLGNAINTTSYEADVFVAPDESYVIFCSTRDAGYGRGDLYISFKRPNGTWTDAVNMGDTINTKNYEYCPFVSKDGKYLFYTSNQDIYWVSTRILDTLRKD